MRLVQIRQTSKIHLEDPSGSSKYLRTLSFLIVLAVPNLSIFFLLSQAVPEKFPPCPSCPFLRLPILPGCQRPLRGDSLELPPCRPSLQHHPSFVSCSCRCCPDITFIQLALQGLRVKMGCRAVQKPRYQPCYGHKPKPLHLLCRSNPTGWMNLSHSTAVSAGAFSPPFPSIAIRTA